MRDPKRIKKFCDELAELWEENVPDWRFWQLICNIVNTAPSDPWFWEEDRMMNFIRNYFEQQKHKIMIFPNRKDEDDEI